jgi:hypothetical protein
VEERTESQVNMYSVSLSHKLVKFRVVCSFFSPGGKKGRGVYVGVAQVQED